jgi:hypothetical protein
MARIPSKSDKLREFWSGMSSVDDFTNLKAITEDIFNTFEAKVPEYSYYYETGVVSKPRIKKLAYTWKRLISTTDVNALGVIEKPSLFNTHIWNKIKNKPYSIVWPIIGALYLSNNTDEEIRNDIVRAYLLKSAFISSIVLNYNTKVLIPNTLWEMFDSIPKQDKWNLASRADTPLENLYSLLEDPDYYDSLSTNPKIDERIIFHLSSYCPSDKIYATYRNLITQNEKGTIKLRVEDIEAMWENTIKSDGVTNLPLFLICSSTPQHLLERIDVSAWDDRSIQCFLNAYPFVEREDAELSRIAFSLIDRNDVPTLLSLYFVNSFLIKTGHISVTEWVEHIDKFTTGIRPHSSSANYSIYEYGLMIKKLLLTILVVEKHPVLLQAFKDEVGIDVSEFTSEMIEETLGWDTFQDIAVVV